MAGLFSNIPTGFKSISPGLAGRAGSGHPAGAHKSRKPTKISRLAQNRPVSPLGIPIRPFRKSSRPVRRSSRPGGSRLVPSEFRFAPSGSHLARAGNGFAPDGRPLAPVRRQFALAGRHLAPSGTQLALGQTRFAPKNSALAPFPTRFRVVVWLFAGVVKGRRAPVSATGWMAGGGSAGIFGVRPQFGRGRRADGVAGRAV